MDERLKNMVFITICESCLDYYYKNTPMSNFSSWCLYVKNHFINIINNETSPIVIEFVCFIFDNLNEIYGFTDEESLGLIFEFFKKEKWGEIKEIAEYTLYIQKNGKLN